jgi:glycopeptide antibiotics resistance protein
MSKTNINDIYVVRIRFDYLLHSVVFIPFAFLYFKAAKPIALNNVWFMAGAGILLATFTEGIQYFLPYRSYNINDLLANYLGGGLGMGGFFLSEKRKVLLRSARNDSE